MYLDKLLDQKSIFVDLIISNIRSDVIFFLEIHF